MDQNLLPKRFFKENPLDELSPSFLAYLSMTSGFDETLQNAILNSGIDPERKARIEAEREEISKLKTGDEVVKFIRSGYDVANRKLLCEKTWAMQAEVIPPLLRRFRTSFLDNVIETSTYIFSYADPAYIDQLIDIYPEIRNPYAQSLACLVFGVQRREDSLSLLLSEYERLKKESPEESFGQGPLLAIYILFDMV